MKSKEWSNKESIVCLFLFFLKKDLKEKKMIKNGYKIWKKTKNNKKETLKDSTIKQ